MPVWKTKESRTHTVVECEIYKGERDALEMKKLDVCDMEEFGRLLKKVARKRSYRWWPQTVKQDAGRISEQFLSSIPKKRNERPNVGGVSIRSRNGAPSRKGCVANGQKTKARDE